MLQNQSSVLQIGQKALSNTFAKARLNLRHFEIPFEEIGEEYRRCSWCLKAKSTQSFEHLKDGFTQTPGQKAKSQRIPGLANDISHTLESWFLLDLPSLLPLSPFSACATAILHYKVAKLSSLGILQDPCKFVMDLFSSLQIPVLFCLSSPVAHVGTVGSTHLSNWSSLLLQAWSCCSLFLRSKREGWKCWEEMMQYDNMITW